MHADGGDTAILKVLVVDAQLFQRRLVAETLRSLSRVSVAYAEDTEQCLMAISYFGPDLIVAEWRPSDSESLVVRLRAGDAGDAYRRVPVIMMADNARAIDVETARNAGADEFVMRPFSAATMLSRVLEVRERRRDFVESARYTGPCRRRRRADEFYDGPRRRLFDMDDKRADAPDVQIRKGLARMYVERLSALLAAADPANRDSMRDLSLASGQLSALASDMKDRLFMSAASSLFNYVTGVGPNMVLVRDVVQAHLDAIKQLAELPNYQLDVRQTVTQQLSVMVVKKLRQAGQAA
jgi:CheY-like chemotaxis protein